MTKKQEEKLEGMIIKAVQSGKKETSGLVADIIEKIEPAVARNIEKYVNGHLREVKSHLEEQDKKLAEIPKILTEQAKVAEELKSLKIKTEPVVENRMTVIRVGRFVIWTGAVAGAIGAFVFLFKEIKDLLKL